MRVTKLVTLVDALPCRSCGLPTTDLCLIKTETGTQPFFVGTLCAACVAEIKNRRSR